MGTNLCNVPPTAKLYICGNEIKSLLLGMLQDEVPVLWLVSLERELAKFKAGRWYCGVVLPNIVVGSLGLGWFGMSSVSKEFLNCRESNLVLCSGDQLPMEELGGVAAFQLASDITEFGGEIGCVVFMWNCKDPKVK